VRVMHFVCLFSGMLASLRFSTSLCVFTSPVFPQTTVLLSHLSLPLSLLHPHHTFGFPCPKRGSFLPHAAPFIYTGSEPLVPSFFIHYVYSVVSSIPHRSPIHLKAPFISKLICFIPEGGSNDASGPPRPSPPIETS